MPTRIRVGTEGQVEESRRRSRLLDDLGPFAQVLERQALALQPALEAAFGMGPGPAGRPEMELVAHGDGDFFKSHIDTLTGDSHRPGKSRRISLVYYLHRRPRRFTGGRLRLFDLAGAQAQEIEPAHDRLLAFPAFARHEVETVHCLDEAFASRRFSVNIWLRG